MTDWANSSRAEESSMAKVSPELLETIFMNGSPLHDGAVIIQRRPGPRGVVPAAALAKSQRRAGARHAASRGDRHERRQRRGGVGRLGGRRDDFDGAGRGAESRAGAGRGSGDAEETAGLGGRGQMSDATMKLEDFKYLFAAQRFAAASRQRHRAARLAVVLAIGFWIFVNAGERGSVAKLSVPISYACCRRGW